ncbi:unnamed protein product [Leptidea sinapis]|uniref:Uncharacterized protein n=1 Tax=Leptidea sinapis TaxID=189913 RepID=A0A5E4QLQ7_9NEOP|nr:unnamed protein product [Leptidea sinapis]
MTQKAVLVIQNVTDVLPERRRQRQLPRGPPHESTQPQAPRPRVLHAGLQRPLPLLPVVVVCVAVGVGVHGALVGGLVAVMAGAAVVIRHGPPAATPEAKRKWTKMRSMRHYTSEVQHTLLMPLFGFYWKSKSSRAAHFSMNWHSFLTAYSTTAGLFSTPWLMPVDPMINPAMVLRYPVPEPTLRNDRPVLSSNPSITSLHSYGKSLGLRIV